MGEWDLALERHYARRPKPPNCPISISIGEYNRRHREYDEAMRPWLATLDEAMKRVGPRRLSDAIPDGARIDSESNGRIMPIRQVVYGKDGEK